MSGGHWNYQDAKISEELRVDDLPLMMEALRKCFHEVDWALCSDTSKETAKERLWDIINELGDKLFP